MEFGVSWRFFLSPSLGTLLGEADLPKAPSCQPAPFAGRLLGGRCRTQLCPRGTSPSLEPRPCCPWDRGHSGQGWHSGQSDIQDTVALRTGGHSGLSLLPKGQGGTQDRVALRTVPTAQGTGWHSGQVVPRSVPRAVNQRRKQLRGCFAAAADRGVLPCCFPLTAPPLSVSVTDFPSFPQGGSQPGLGQPQPSPKQEFSLLPFSVFSSFTGTLCSEKAPVPSHALTAPSGSALHHDVLPLGFICFF